MTEQYKLREAAEAHLALNSEQHFSNKLQHELQVHMIELELQNEELRQSQNALEESRDRYLDLYEFAPLGYFTLNREGIIEQVNLTGATLLGVERSKILNRRFAGFVSADDSDRWNRHFLNVLQRNISQNCELIFRHSNGSRLNVRLDCMRIGAEDAPSVRIAFTDITGFTGKLQLERDKLNTVFNNTSMGLVITNPQGGDITMNATALRLHGFLNVEDMHNRVEEYANNWELRHANGSLIPYAEWPLVRAIRGDYSTDIVIHYHNLNRGSVMICNLTSAPVRNYNGEITFLVMTLFDITELKRSELQLRDLTANLQLVREEEKANIAREIHDDLGGTLTALKMETYWLKTELEANRRASVLFDHVMAISKSIDYAASAMRNIITGLRPVILDKLGLLAAIEWHADQFHKSTGITCRVNCIGEHGGLNQSCSVGLFRILQEALTNVNKHSGATCVEIEYLHNEDEVVMSIIDNGCGLAKKYTSTSATYGLLGMTERVSMLGGKINFDPPPHGGFNVTVVLPLHEKRMEQP